MNAKAFFDTNVLLYLAGDPVKAIVVRRLLETGGVMSVQVLNEFAHVARGKFALTIRAIRELLGIVRELCEVSPLTVTHHDDALRLADRYRLRLYDALIVAVALDTQCELLYSEDLHAGQIFDRRLKIVNPFI
jgi:predicted nucleic acid-binding protein